MTKAQRARLDEIDTIVDQCRHNVGRKESLKRDLDKQIDGLYHQIQTLNNEAAEIRASKD